jgi:hypothetical protein
LARLASLRQLEMKYPEHTAMEDRREYWDLLNNPREQPRLTSILRTTAEATIASTEAGIQSLGLPDEVVERQREVIAVEEKIETAQNKFDDLRVGMKTVEGQQGKLHLAGQTEQKLERAQKELEYLKKEKEGLEEAVVGAMQELMPNTQQTDNKGTLEADEATVEEEFAAAEHDVEPLSDEETMQMLRVLLKQLAEAKTELLAPKKMLKGEVFAPYVKFSEEQKKLEAVVEERAKEIEELALFKGASTETNDKAKQLTMEAEEKGSSLSIEQALGQMPAMEDDGVPRVNLAERLLKLRELQREDEARLITMQQEARDEFVNSDADVSRLLPHSWRDPKYWPGEDEAESAESYGQDDVYLRRAREEREREEEVKREESRGFLSRIGGWFTRRKA